MSWLFWVCKDCKSWTFLGGYCSGKRCLNKWSTNSPPPPPLPPPPPPDKPTYILIGTVVARMLSNIDLLVMLPPRDSYSHTPMKWKLGKTVVTFGVRYYGCSTGQQIHDPALILNDRKNAFAFDWGEEAYFRRELGKIVLLHSQFVKNKQESARQQKALTWIETVFKEPSPPELFTPDDLAL